jgi:tRNA-specific 2-thiouridylase
MRKSNGPRPESPACPRPPRVLPARMAKVLSALSGGVDSSVATALLLEQGHDVTAAYMKNWINEDNIAGDCPWMQDIDDARAVAEKLGIEFRVVNLMRDYRERVVQYLLEGYRSGVTPNPDVMCNREIKFGVFLKYAQEQGFDSVATGHYARVRHDPERSCIFRGADPGKDQTYFLAMLQQHQARHALFPIGHLLKSEVRARAAALGLPNAAKKDSQGICFIGQVKMTDFLRAYVPDEPGDIISQDGKKLGQHRGLHLYTLGQRKGLGVPSNTFKEAYVVVEKRPATRELVLAFDHPDTPHLYASRCTVTSLSWLHAPPAPPARMDVQPRYRCPGQPSQVEDAGPGRFRVIFNKPQRALSPGQICAFYHGDELLGGGIFENIEYS